MLAGSPYRDPIPGSIELRARMAQDNSLESKEETQRVLDARKVITEAFVQPRRS